MKLLLLIFFLFVLFYLFIFYFFFLYFVHHNLVYVSNRTHCGLASHKRHSFYFIVIISLNVNYCPMDNGVARFNISVNFLFCFLQKQHQQQQHSPIEHNERRRQFEKLRKKKKNHQQQRTNLNIEAENRRATK